MRRAVSSLLVAGFGLMILLLAWLAWMEPRMIFYPLRDLEQTPARLGWSFEEIWIRAGDGVRIHGWFVPAAAQSSAGRVTVLFLHGNAGNIGHRFEKLAILKGLGADVLIVDYRGYGRSEGRPSEAGLYRDADAAYRHLTQARGVDPGTIVLYGESLGTAVAARLASEVEVAGVVLEAAFTSVADVGQAMFPFLPVRWVVRNRFDTLRAIPQVRAPILVLHSRDDEFFPLRHAQRLVAAASPRARLVELQGGHNEAFLTSGAAYRRALSDFLGAR
jgi:fermentation-respiration switch protein FrsA (DUF1100 family)